MNFHLDCYANHQESYLFASSFKELYKPVQDPDGSINRYQRYLTYVMNFPTFKHKMSDTDYEIKKTPQAFFEIKDTTMGHDPAMHSKQKREQKLSNMEILIKDDIVEDLAFSTNEQFLITLTVQKEVICFKVPKYERVWKSKVELSQRIASLNLTQIPLPPTCYSAVAIHDSGENFAIGTATGHLLFYSIKKASRNQQIRLTDTQESILTHSLVGHVDYVSILRYTPFGRLLSGGADSNIKVFAYFEKETLAPEYVFIKHCDEIDAI